ncbi:DUF305 domain-containing protein [Nonomuraea endophytica]|uniref:Uncharacterized protein (DUF305 family) n=1 Tax=Nonomuraea endophytica TaxID=714136 RepID=A0A7W8EFU7_9ACTN|nr:DUF305 domain-containing protein [Nonomuraea endophytica]MBB5077798.1 uncharacterized protein (DUF305 family) [Nonomuraea endophytica]
MSVQFRPRLLFITVLLTFALAACATESAGPSPVGTDAPVLVPHAPGSPARTATPGERLPRPEQQPSAADVRFAEGMIPHHRQALEMAGLVAERTRTPSIRRVADQIRLTQEPEIRIMSGWLSALGRAVPQTHGHPTGQPANGMATLTEMNALRAARDGQFDRMFLRLMIRHHEGALTMADAALREGTDQRMRMMARDVAAGQSIEIARMREAMRSLPAL